ncbi:MAG: hypothetical protein GWO08_02760, partial [Gammaproteobacteria bacterium]|nr:hypothetical protein [Phycisphaerae bacterium]NIR92612.1 hypothetical protein [Gammaproteobacteria bacterium]NIW46435.1 hypothetical protein [Gammaproteobacteria bacterium]
RFSRNIVFELASLYQDVDAGIADLVLQDIQDQKIDITLHESDMTDVRTYVSGHRNFSSVRVALWRYLLDLYIKGLAADSIDNKSRQVLVRCLVQGHDVESVSRQYGYASSRAMESDIKTALERISQ